MIENPKKLDILAEYIAKLIYDETITTAEQGYVVSKIEEDLTLLRSKRE